MVWGSFPRLVRTGIKVGPEGLPHVSSRLTLALLMSGFIPLGTATFYGVVKFLVKTYKNSTNTRLMGMYTPPLKAAFM